METEPPPTQRTDTAVLFLTHQWSEAIENRFVRLRREMGAHADCFVLLDSDNSDVVRAWRSFAQALGAPQVLAPFVTDQLPAQLGFAFYGKERMLGNTHFPLLRFARDTAYRLIWQVECDVEYRGNWLGFFGSFAANAAALVAAHIHHHSVWPTWYWWRSLQVPQGGRVTPANLYKAFMPVFRLTRTALDAIDEAQRRGWKGHFEVLIPTILCAHGHRIEDLRAANPCYVGDSQNPCEILPIQSTMRWRPEISIPEFMRRGHGPLLFHPVKENWAFDGEKVVTWPKPQPDPGLTGPV